MTSILSPTFLTGQYCASLRNSVSWRFLQINKNTTTTTTTRRRRGDCVLHSRAFVTTTSSFCNNTRIHRTLLFQNTKFEHYYYSRRKVTAIATVARNTLTNTITKTPSSLSCLSFSSMSSSSISTDKQEQEETKNQPQRHRLDVAIVGAPNAGKSQLLNIMTKSNVAAVSRKRHTTRDGILGARTFSGNDGNEIPTQLVFIDTPGFLRFKDAKEEGLLRDLITSASNEMKYADYTLLVIDAARTLTDDLKEALITLMLQAKYSQGREEIVFRKEELLLENEGFTKEEQTIMSSLGPMERFEVDPKEKFAIVLNKVDLVQPKKKLLDIATDIGAIADEVLMYNDHSPNNTDRDIAEEEDEGSNHGQEGQGNRDDDDQQQGVSSENQNTHDTTTNNNIEDCPKDMELLAEISPPIFYVSALENDGVEDIVQYLKERATPSQTWAVEPDEVTDQSPIERVEEIIREKIYRCLHKEVPHQVKQVNRMFQTMRHKETKQRGIRIHQDLVVKTKSHQRLVLGRGGKTLQRIQQQAQRDIERVFSDNYNEDVIVSLQLKVRLRKSQHDEPLEAAEYGLQREVTWNDLKK